MEIAVWAIFNSINGRPIRIWGNVHTRMESAIRVFIDAVGGGTVQQT